MTTTLYHTNPILLYRYFKCLNSINDIIKLYICTDGIKVYATNPSNTIFISSVLSCDSFNEYDLVKEIEIALNLKILTKILNRAEITDSIKFLYDPDDEDVLKVQLENSNRLSEFNINLIHLDTSIQIIPELNHPIHLDIHVPRLQSICNDIDLIESTEITFRSVRNNKLKITSSGDYGNYKIKLKENSKCVRKISSKKLIGNKICKISVEDDEYILYPYKTPINVSFSINMIEHILDVNPLVDKVKLSIGNNLPLLAYAEFEDNSFISYYVSPKITD